MLFTDTYITIQTASQGEYKDKGSKFIGYAFPINTEEDVKELLQKIKSEHHAAAHHCYAYVLGAQKQIQKSNDDREPNNSAGKPILRSIVSKDLTNTLVIVVRYFGGKLLGVPGLITAYGEATNEALNKADVTEKIVCEYYKISGDYTHENEVYKAYKLYGAKLIEQNYHENQFNGIFEIRKSKADLLLTYLKEKRLFEITFITEK
ncbi:MAG: YigZ family protein [Bacteroidia bacterium]|nr:YigZ family protein [Bacteroidia bacterium]